MPNKDKSQKIVSKNVVIFTKTLWNEPPRLRHQLSKMLSSYGHTITFFEKTMFKPSKTKNYVKNIINLIRHYEFLHHQLKPFGILIKLNQLVVKYFIEKNTKSNDIDLIINFNYDYDFLKELFPDVRIVTIINDDFVAQAKPWMRNAIKMQLESTCRKSDVVFTVSYFLEEQLRNYTKNVQLLLPWADREYIEIKRNNPKKILIWGYITPRYDFSMIESVALTFPEYTINIIGGIHKSISSTLYKLLDKYKNIVYSTPKNLDDIDLNNYFVCFAPYNLSEETKAISITNKSFQVFARGLAMVNHGMPNFIEKSFIANCKNIKEVHSAIQECREGQIKYQIELKSFVNSNQEQDRYNVIKKIF